MTGRKLIDIDYQYVEQLASQGMTQQQIAYCLDRSPITLIREFKTDENLVLAFEKGRCKGIATITNASYMRSQDPNGTIDRIFWLKNVAGWQDKQETQVSGDITVNVQKFAGNIESPVNVNNDCINAEYDKINEE